MARLLMLGTVNHPHVEHLAIAMAERDFDVVVGGDALTELPPSRLPAAGIDLYPAPDRSRSSLSGAAAHIRWIRRLRRELEPDVVHGHWLCGFAFFAAVAGARPLAAMAWGSDVLKARPAQTAANRVALRRAELALADSQALLDRLVALGADPADCRLVNWGVDRGVFRPVDADARRILRAKLGLGDGPVVLSPRSLMPVYNPRIILAAWREIAAERPDAQLVLKHMGVVREELGELPFADRVHVVGHVDYERMADYYGVADVCLSITSSDSAPRTVFEAMACGAPCVLSDLPWVHEQIADEREALIVPIDSGAVAAAVRRLLADRELATGIAARGAELVARHHDRDAHMDRLAAVYRALASARTPTM